MRAKMRADVAHYKQSYDLLQEEFEQFRAKNDPAVIQVQVRNIFLFGIVALGGCFMLPGINCPLI